ncbi:MAG TPA: ATP-binding protein [Bradyrhizobium sp.]
MMEIAAKPGFSSRRLRASRLTQYTLVQVLIVIVCIFVLHQSLPQPPSRYLVTEFNAKEGGTERAVTLPHYTSSRFSMSDPPLYTGDFAWPGSSEPNSEAQHAWSVFLPRFNNGVEVAVNGVVILDSRRDPAANRADRNAPEIAVIPASLLHDGANNLTIRLFVWGPLTGFLDRVYVGPDQILRPFYEQRTLLFVTLPVVFSAWQGILAVILAIMWGVRRHEPAYGILAAAMALGLAQSFLPTAVDQSQYSRLNAILITSAPLESGFVLTFAMFFLGLRWPRYGALIFAPGLILVAVGLFGNQAQISELFLFIGVPAVGLYLVLLALIVAQSVLKRQDVASFVLGCTVTIVLICWIRDMLSVLQIAPEGRIFVARLSYSAMLVAIGAGLTWRFARALNQVDSFAGRLVTQVRQAEDKLKASFAREEERARAAALALERTRLMRDLHDGLGGQLVSIVALSERGDASAPIGDAARAALKDLRLVIDSMDDIGGDLMLALGSWRERATAQLRPHDIALDWRAVTPQGLPVHPELRPWHVIQIVRLLDEAVTNAVKHADARRITVSIETLADASGFAYGRITVEDDGKGFALTPDGAAAAAGHKAARGLRNMQNRAARCGVKLELNSGAGGTRVRLTLPRRFPDSDSAGA